MAVEEVTVRASMRDELSRPLANVRREVRRTAAETRALGNAAGRDGVRGMTRLERATQNITGRLRGAHDRTMALSQALGRNLARGATVAAGALGAASAAATYFGLKTASTMENGLVALESLTGSAEKANSVFAMLKELDVAVPFDLAQMQQAAVALISIGTPLEGLRGQLEGIANVAAGTADPQGSFSRIVRAVTQMRSLGRVSAEELNQLVDAGVGVARFIPEAFGMSLQEARALMERGHDFDPEALIRTMFGSTEGFAERAQQTLSGQLSSLKSVVMVEMSDAASPLLEAVKSALPDLTDGIRTMLREVAPPLVNLGVTLLSLAVQALPVIAPLLGTLADVVGTLATAAAPAFAALEPVIDEISVALLELTSELVPVMPDLVRLFVALIGILPDLIRIAADLLPPIATLAGLAADLLQYDAVAQTMAYLLAVLLGYRALAGIVGTLYAFAGGLTAVNAAQAGGGAAGAAGALGGRAGLARGLGGAALAIPGLMQAGQYAGGEQANLGSDLGMVGSFAGGGAVLGSVVPGVGTLVGGLGGAAVGGGIAIANRLFGKPAKQSTAPTLDAATVAAMQAGRAEAASIGTQVNIPAGGIVVTAAGQIDYETGLARGIERYERDRNERG